MIIDDDLTKPILPSKIKLRKGDLGLAREGQFVLLVAGFGNREPSVTVLPV